MTNPLRVLGISGSLRKGSFNTALVHAAATLAPAGTVVEMAEIGTIPPYNDDVRAHGYPEPVAKLREQIVSADALLIASPEYNYSISGVLKNAIDWASRPPNQPFAGKPLGIMGASGGVGGTMRAQYHLRQIAVYLDMHAINKPEVFLRGAQAAFDAEGRLTDDVTKKLIVQLLEALGDFARRLKA